MKKMKEFTKSDLQEFDEVVYRNGDKDIFYQGGFRGKNAKYILEMNNSEIVHESLDCILAKNKGHAINISHKRVFLSEKIFKDKSIIDDFKLLIDKFWGKHSFLAILMHEYSDKSAHYYKDKISKNLLDILFYLRRMSCNL